MAGDSLPPQGGQRGAGTPRGGRRHENLARGLHQLGMESACMLVAVCDACEARSGERATAAAAVAMLGHEVVEIDPSITFQPALDELRGGVALCCPEGEAWLDSNGLPMRVVGTNLGHLWWKRIELVGASRSRALPASSSA